MKELEIGQPIVQKIVDNIETVIVGKRNEIILSLTAILGQGHLLLEDVPGVGKTMLIRSLANSIGAKFKRIQFTPDLLPSDITGSSIYNPKDMKFEYREGPIMANIVLADEINRSSPKTQSSLLEGMEEKSITIDGVTKRLPDPFFVMATQNPVEYEGTYPLPEAQLDRFLIKLNMGYPTVDEEIEVLDRALLSQKSDVDSVVTLEEVKGLINEAKLVLVNDNIKRYIVEITQKTRNHNSIFLGVSPRGSLALMKAAQSLAFIQGRSYCIPDDVQFLAPYVLSHRMILHSDARFLDVKAESIIKDIIDDISLFV